MDKKKIYYSTPGLLTVIIFASNFLSTDLFKAGYQNFSVWFVLSVFAFACGWLINKTLGYNHGGKIVFSVIVASAFVSILMISLFSEYFGLSALLVENMILYILRNITLGSMAFFGMAICELIILQRNSERAKVVQYDGSKEVANAQKEAQILIDEAKLKSEKMLYQTQQKVDEMVEKKNQIERRLKEFIASERELIKNYQSEE